MADMRHNVGMVLPEQTVPPLTLGWRLQMALDHAGRRGTDLMDRFEISRGTVSRWCRDIGPRPKRFILEEIAAMCGVPADWFTEAPSPQQTSKPVGYLVSPPTSLSVNALISAAA